MITTGGVETDRPKSFAGPAQVEQSIPKRFAEIAARHANRTAVSAGSASSMGRLESKSIGFVMPGELRVNNVLICSRPAPC